jgi:hypothetical protein
LAFANGFTHLLAHFQAGLCKALRVASHYLFYKGLMSGLQQRLSPKAWQDPQAHNTHLLVTIKPVTDGVRTALIEFG